MALTTAANLTAKKLWARQLIREALYDTVFAKGKPFMGKGPNCIIQVMEDLAKERGDTLYVNLVAKLGGDGVTGDNILEGNEQQLITQEMNISIDQKRQGIRIAGRMEQKKTVVNLREEGGTQLKQWFTEFYENSIFRVLGGDTTFAFANTGQSPVPTSGANIRLIYGGDATGGVAGDLDSSDIFQTLEIDRMVGYARTSTPQIRPVKVDGMDLYPIFVHTWQAQSLRTDEAWINAQHNSAMRGSKNPIFTGALGMWNQAIVYESPRVKTFTNYGAGSNLPAARAMLLGCQAAIFAKGGGETWEEKNFDYGNQPGVAMGAIFGIKKSRFTIDGAAQDLGVLCCDTYAAAPAGVAH